MQKTWFGLGAALLLAGNPAETAASPNPQSSRSGPVAPSPEAGGASLTEVPCTDVPRWETLTAEQRGRVRCGRLRVPLDHAAPDGRAITLAVAVRAGLNSGGRSPLVILNGSSFGSIRTIVPSFAVPYPQDRDVLLIDPRGMDASELGVCRDTTRQKIAAMAQDVAGEVLRRAYHAPLEACRAEMRAANIPPHVFGAVAMARDIERLRQALGHDRLLFIGQSQGTTVAPTYAALFPGRVEAMVLDSPYPADPTPKSLTESFREGLTGADAWCRGRAICGPAGEGLLAAFDTARAALGRAPMALSTATFGRFVLNADDFDLITQNLFYPGVHRAVEPGITPHALGPAFIAAVAAREATLAGRIADQSLGRLVRGPHSAVFASGECRDRSRYRRPPPTFTGVELIDFSTVCGWWSDAPVDPVRWPTEGSVPTLVLSGSADPVTPVSFGRTMVERLGGSAWQFVVPGVGHGVANASPCGRAVALAFLTEPRLDRVPAVCPE